MSAPGVIVTVGVVVATAEATALTKGNLTMRPVIAGFILVLFLFGVNSANENFANVMMVLIVIGSLIGNGASLIELITKAPYAAKA